MEFLNALKLDRWWSIILWLGLIFLLVSAVYDIDFLENKQMFGLGMGLILVGLSLIIAESSFSFIKPPNVYTGGAALITQRTIEHNIATRLMLSVGIVVSLLFFGLIVYSLV